VNPTESVDHFAHANPAFVASVLHWMARGYAETCKEVHLPSRHLSPAWAILGLALIAPDKTRAALPRRANAKLALLFTEKHPEWRAYAADSMRVWAAPFWRGARYGVATGILTFEDGRLVAVGDVEGRDLFDSHVQERAVTLGKLMGKEGSDAALRLVFGVEVSD
jgi:hypothetical protein